jgi:hypothetical protein
MTPSQLAEIRERDAIFKDGNNGWLIDGLVTDRRSLLALVDSQSAEIARLREALDKTAMLLRGWRNTHLMNRHENSPINSTRQWLREYEASLTEIAK